MEERVRIRAAETADLETVNAYAYAEGMDALAAVDDVHVAVNDAGEIVGFIRLVFDGAGICHVNPVVVYPTWRGLGVGRLLMDFALERYGEVRFVSRGSSLAFYEALGYERIGWDQIAPAVAADCDGCELFGECGPVPMGKKR